MCDRGTERRSERVIEGGVSECERERERERVRESESEIVIE